MRDPYLYEKSQVLTNKLNIRAQEELDDVETDYVVYRLKDLTMNPLPVEYSDPFDITKDIHFILFDMKQKPWKDMDKKRASVRRILQFFGKTLESASF